MKCYFLCSNKHQIWGVFISVNISDTMLSQSRLCGWCPCRDIIKEGHSFSVSQEGNFIEAFIIHKCILSAHDYVTKYSLTS